MHEQYEAVRSPHASLGSVLKRMSDELGIDTPRLYIAKAFPPLFGGEAPNMMANLPVNKRIGGSIVMTRSHLEVFKFDPHSGHVPAEVIAGLGHELAHFRQGSAYVNAVRKYPLILGPIAGAAALYLYDKARSGQADATSEPTKEALLQAMDMQAQSEITSIDDTHQKACAFCGVDSPHAEISAQVSNSKKQTVEAGRYVAAGALGLAAGAQVTRNLMLQLEYEADRVGAQMAKDPQAMISSLNAFYSHLQKMPRDKLIEQHKQITVLDHLSGYTIHAHPDVASRVRRLEEMIVKDAPARLAHSAEQVISHIPML